MDNFAPQLKQQGYTNQFREDYEFSVKQAGVSNEDLLGQAFTGAADIAATGYKIAEKHEAEAAKTAKEQNEERVRQAYNEFARKKMDIDRKAEQTQQWSRHDMETRMLVNDFSKIKGVEAGKLFELAGKTDFTGAYSREKDTRKFWNDKNNEAKYKAVEAMRLANPSLAAALTPEETLSITEAAGDSIDSSIKYLSQLETIDKNKNPAEYNRVKNNMVESLNNNIVSTALVEILNNKDSVNSSADLEAFRFNTIEKLVKKGFDRATSSVIVEQSIKRSGMEDVVKSINNFQDFTSQDFERTIKYNVNMGKAYMGALDNMYSALMVSSDKWRAGEYFNENLRIAGKTWNDRLGELAKVGSMSALNTTTEDRGTIYQGAVNILKSRVSASAKGHSIKAVFDDVEKNYGDAPAEERVQVYTEILKNFDNPYLDVNIQELLSSNKAEHRELGKILKQERERIINAKNMAVYEISGTTGAVALNQVKQGPGADLLRVNEDGQLVVIDGSKGFLQSTAITLSDMTGRYFGNVATFNTDFADKYKDAETRKKLLIDGGIPEFNPSSETVIGRKEWYLGTGDNHIKARQQLEQNVQPGEWDFNAVEGLGGKIWEGIKENTRKGLDNTTRMGKAVKDLFTVEGTHDSSPFGQVLGLSTSEKAVEIEKLEKILENEELKPHIRRAVEGTIEILKNQDGTTAARLSRSEPLAFAQLDYDNLEVYKLIEKGTEAENELLQSMGEYDTFLGVAAEGLYQERKKSLPKTLQSEEDYDLRGAYKAGLLDNVEEGMHLPDTFKKPNHITFSKESKYYEEGMWAGEWVDDYTFKIPLNTPKAKLAKLKEYFAKYEPGARIMIDNPKALEELREIEGEEDSISRALSSDPYMHEGYVNMYEKDKEKLMHKRHRVLKDIYIYPGE